MSNVNVNSAAVSNTTNIDMQAQTAAHTGGHIGIMALVNELIQVNSKLRDVENQYSVEQQLNSYDSWKNAYDHQKDAAGKHAKASFLEGIGSVAGGMAAFGSVGLGHFANEGFSKVVRQNRKEFRNAVAEGNLSAANKAIASTHLKKMPQLADLDDKRELYRQMDRAHHARLETVVGQPQLLTGMADAGFKMAGSNINNGASSLERIADLDKTNEKNLEKDAEKYSQSAHSVSSDMRQAISSLVQIQSKINDAISIH